MMRGRLFGSARGRRALDDLDQDIRDHLERETQDNIDRGMPPEEARRQAMLAFGSVALAREDTRRIWIWPWLDELRQDVRYALRTMRRHPGFAAVVVLTLALGIGANTAIFSVVNGVLLQPLPYDAPDRQVRLRVTLEARTGPPDVRLLTLTAADTRELGQRARAFDHVGNITLSLANWPGHEPRWSGGVVTASVFPMLGVRPVLGRLFGSDDEVEGAPGVMILSYGAWQRHFAGAPGVLGRTITLEPALTFGGPAEPKLYTVVGVMPAGFEYLPGSETSYWIPLQRSGRGFVVARLGHGVSAASAAAEIEPILQELQGRRSGPRPLRYEIVGLHEQLVAPVRTALLVLMGAVGLVLLIACVNVANLRLAQSLAREREMTIRTALGAGRARIVRLMMTESVLLTAMAAAVGMGLAAGGVSLLRWLATTIDRIDLGQGGGRLIPRLDAISFDVSVLTFTITLAVGVGVLSGLVPMVQQFRTMPTAALRNGSGTTTFDRTHGRRLGMRNALVVAQVALTIVLLVGGGLLITSFIKLLRVDVGYDPERLLTFQVSLPSARYQLPRLRTFAEEFTSRLGSVPGVVAAAYANQLPLVQLQDTLALGRTPDAERQPGPGGDVRVVSRTYFSTMRIRLIAGRVLDERDGAGAPKVLVLNDALARRDFGGSANAIGQQVYVWRDTSPWTIVGVVADVRQFGLDTAAGPQFFLDARQWGEGLSPLFPLGPYYTIRFGGDPDAVVAAAHAVVTQSEAEGVLFNVASMTDIISTTVARPRMYTVLLGVFALVGVAMALVGIYGVMSYTVSQRTRELGIRMALGARHRAVLGLVLRQSLLSTALGVVLGLLGAAALTRFLETMLFDLTPLDATTFASVALLFTVIAALAAYVPARRATLVDPLVALKAE